MLRSSRLNYVHDDCHCVTADQGVKGPRFHCYRHYLLALKLLSQLSILTFQDASSSKAEGKIQAPDLRRGLLSLSLNRRKGHPKLLLAKLLLLKLSQTRPLQNVQIGASCLPTTKDGPRTFWSSSSWVGSPHPTGQSLVHNCQLHYSYWNYSVVHLVRKLVVNCC